MKGFIHIVKSESLYNIHISFVHFIEYSFIARAVIAQSV
jgi:hypothetical protein